MPHLNIFVQCACKKFKIVIWLSKLVLNGDIQDFKYIIYKYILLLCLEYTLDSLEMQQMNIVDAVSTTNDDDIEESCVRYNFKWQNLKCP